MKQYKNQHNYLYYGEMIIYVQFYDCNISCTAFTQRVGHIVIIL